MLLSSYRLISFREVNHVENTNNIIPRVILSTVSGSHLFVASEIISNLSDGYPHHASKLIIH